MKRALLLVVAIMGLVTYTQAQYNAQNYTDVIQTNDGLILQGTIVEQIPGVTYTIVTLDGATHKIDALNIKRITKEAVSSRVVTENHNYYHDPYMRYKLDAEGNPIYPLSVTDAFVRSLCIPGLGQLGNGQGLKGALLFTGTLVGVLGATVGANVAPRGYSDLVGWSGVTVAAACYLYSLIDAPLTASLWNKKHGFVGADYYVRLVPAFGTVTTTNGSDAAVGMSLSLSF